MARRFTNRQTRRGPRRQTLWLGGVSSTFDVTVLAAGASAIVSAFDTRVLGGQPKAPFTIIRTIGQLLVTTSSVAGTTYPHGAIGSMIINGEAFDAGVVSMPTPFTEASDNRWYLHQYFALTFQLSAVGSSVPTSSFLVSSSAMRKVGFGDVLVNVIENGSDSDAFNFVYNARQLVKLS